MKLTIFVLAAVLLLPFVLAAPGDAGKYVLAYWREIGHYELNSYMAEIMVFDEYGNPKSGISIGTASSGAWLGTTNADGRVEIALGSSWNDGFKVLGATSDSTPAFKEDREGRRYRYSYDVGFLYVANDASPVTANMTYDGILNDSKPNECDLTVPRTRSLNYYGTDPLHYCSDEMSLAGSGAELGQTFVATSDRAVCARALCTTGASTTLRWQAQLLEGGLNGIPIGKPKVTREHQSGAEYYQIMIRWALDEAPLTPGQTYYLKITNADSTWINLHKHPNNYPSGTLYLNGSPVSGNDMMAFVCCVNSNASNVGTISGVVRDSGGVGIKDAKVELSSGSQVGLTNASGQYKIGAVIAGAYTVTASAPGYVSQPQTGKSVSAGATTTVNFTMVHQASPVTITSVSIQPTVLYPGMKNVRVTVSLSNPTSTDERLTSKSLKFTQGGSDISSHFLVTPDTSNPDTVKRSSTAALGYTVEVLSSAPPGQTTVEATVAGWVNLQPNGSVEETSSDPPPPPGWVTSSTAGTFAIDNSTWYHGSRSYRFNWSTTTKKCYFNAGSGDGATVPRIPVEPLMKYTTSFRCKVADADENQLTAHLVWVEYDAGGAQIGDPFNYDVFKKLDLDVNWKLYEFTYTTSANCRYIRSFIRMTNLWEPEFTATIWMDDLQVKTVATYQATGATSATIVAPVVCGSVAATRSYPDDTGVKLTGRMVTGYPVDQTTIFYVEDPDRTSGIAVDKTNGTGQLSVVAGESVIITAMLDTVNGERRLINPMVSKSSGTLLEPVALPGCALGGSAEGYTPGVEGGVGANNVGLLIKTWGAINNAGGGKLYINDGSKLGDGIGQGVKVISGSITVPSGKTFAVVTGFSSVEAAGGKFYRVVRPRSASDIAWF